jgi:histidine triad (HIT) family protein
LGIGRFFRGGPVADFDFKESAMPSIFTKIINREIPATIVYEDEHCLAFRDVRPQAPTHVLLIPKREIPAIDAISADDQELLGHLWVTIPKIAQQEGLGGGYRVVVNNGPDAGQTVDHIHFHILGGRPLAWPPG